MNLLRCFLVCCVAITISNLNIAAKPAANHVVKAVSKTNLGKKAAIVIDYSNGQKVLFSDRADAKRYPASLTKMMTLYLLFDALKNKKITLNTKFRVSKLASIQQPSKLGLKAGATISVSDIIKALLVKSANDVAVVAAEGLARNIRNFSRLMNQKSRLLGMKNTHFENPSGLPDTKQFSTARDLAKLGMALYRDFPQHHKFFSLRNFSYGKSNYSTHCKILHWYKGADGAKTGYICASGFNLIVSASRYNKAGTSKRLFVVVMGGNTAKARDIYAGELMDKYFGEYKITAQKPVAKLPSKSLSEQISKSEMLDEIIYADDEVSVSKENFDAMLDNLYKDDDELLAAEDEIIVTPRKTKGRKQK